MKPINTTAQTPRQAAAASALASLLTHYGMQLPPVIAWHIDATGEVRGRLAVPPEGPVAAIRRVHRVLGGSVTSYEHDDGCRHLKATIPHLGQTITLWTPTAP
ncbi:hypothetical protein RVR_P228 (plasmid) [Actinacidiphila reveromycinica]|uniref:Uncharacterized protein n=1 Tax=Actinacidiphila reveromycinica TaxID=659352 RepID=A0A7U3LGB6_9ACTN|nr:hypothetical protein [Streptomyces sp. SN-593]BBG20770.1 hypothetical protein RVR_P228 [Streptomyces sp. SN-593]